MLFRDVVERHLLGPDEVLHAHLERLEPSLPRDKIKYELERVADARPCDAAIGHDRTFVSRNGPGAATKGWEIVRAWQNTRDLGRLEAGGEGIGGISA